MFVYSEFELTFSCNYCCWLTSLLRVPSILPAIVIALALAASIGRWGFVEAWFSSLLLLNWLLNDGYVILEFVNVQEHGLNAEEAIYTDLVHDLDIILNLIFEELAYEWRFKPLTLLQNASEETKEGSLITR